MFYKKYLLNKPSFKLYLNVCILETNTGRSSKLKFIFN